MHEEKIALVDGQVKAVQQAVAARAVENVYFVACGGSLATLYPGNILERETAAVSTGAYTAAEFLNDPPARLGEKSLVVLNSQSGGTPETAAAARLATGRGALTAAFTTTPGSARPSAPRRTGGMPGNRSAKTSLTLANIEAMAEQESPDGERKDLCLQTGYICVGIDKNGIDGEHHGLMRGE